MPQDVFFTPEFKRNLRQLAKKYRRIKNEIKQIITAHIANQEQSQ